MGGVSDQEEVVKAALKPAADVQVLPAHVMLDDSSRWSRALDGGAAEEEVLFVVDEDEDPDLVGICQICMDVVPKRQIVTRVCGAECLAEVCAQCLVQHVIATVYSFYPGVLPKVRCPICLTLLNKNQWQHFAVPALKEGAEEEEEEEKEEQPQAVEEVVAAPEERTATDVENGAEADAVSGESDSVDSVMAGRESDSTATADADSDSSVDGASSESDTSESTQSDSTASETVDPVTSEPENVDTTISDPAAPAEAAVAAEASAEAPAQQQEDEWVDDNSHVLDKYEMLCCQSCGFQSPCCHNTDYTMLPPMPTRKQARAVVVPLTPEREAALPELLSLCRAFCFHREETAVLYDRLVALFAEEAEDMLALLLPRITDEERRATLLLHHLFVNPNAVTRCCGEKVCFKCKASDHHDGYCNDFIEEESVLECRGCHVTLVKVDGCDTVACLCGYSFSWQAEVDQRRMQRRQLAPAGDREFVQWQRWHRRLAASFAKIDSVDETMREARLARMLRVHRPLLQRVFLPHILRKRQEQKNQLAVNESDAIESAGPVEVAP